MKKFLSWLPVGILATFAVLLVSYILITFGFSNLHLPSITLGGVITTVVTALILYMIFLMVKIVHTIIKDHSKYEPLIRKIDQIETEALHKAIVAIIKENKP